MQVRNISNRITPENVEQKKTPHTTFDVSPEEEKSPEEVEIPLLIKEAVQYLSTFGKSED